jgi:hypothetical protein
LLVATLLFINLAYCRMLLSLASLLGTKSSLIMQQFLHLLVAKTYTLIPIRQRFISNVCPRKILTTGWQRSGFPQRHFTIHWLIESQEVYIYWRWSQEGCYVSSRRTASQCKPESFRGTPRRNGERECKVFEAKLFKLLDPEISGSRRLNPNSLSILGTS